jgi:hypothetical protein
VCFAAITLCVASKRVFIAVSVYFFMTQSENFWIKSHIRMHRAEMWAHQFVVRWRLAFCQLS